MQIINEELDSEQQPKASPPVSARKAARAAARIKEGKEGKPDRGGRLKGWAGEPRKPVTAHLTPARFDWLQRGAATAGMKTSAFAAHLLEVRAKGYRPPKARLTNEQEALIQRVAEMSNDLRQVKLKLEAAGALKAAEDIGRLARQLHIVLNDVS